MISQVQAMSLQKTTKLFHAACRGNVDQCLLLLKAGADVNAENEDGMTPLMMATLKNQVGVVKFLLEQSCNLDVRTNNGRTALHLAIWNKRRTITQLLLKHGCNTNIQDQFGDTPLMIATQRGYTKLVKTLLVTSKCDIYTTGPEKDTALHHAARHGRPECIGLLKKYGADLKLRNIWGHTPLLVAAVYGNPRSAIELIKEGADIDVFDRTQRTVLHHAVKNNLTSLVVVLLRKGARIMTRDFYGNMPLTEAIQYGDPNIIAFLIRANCDVNAKGACIIDSNFHGHCSPVVIALHKDRFDVADLLIQSGCETEELLEELTVGVLASKMEADPKMREWYRRTFNEPSSLIVLSRRVLITYLRTIPFAEINMMIIPPGLTDCLNYKDVLKSCKPASSNTLFHYFKSQIIVKY